VLRPKPDRRALGNVRLSAHRPGRRAKLKVATILRDGRGLWLHTAKLVTENNTGFGQILSLSYGDNLSDLVEHLI